MKILITEPEYFDEDAVRILKRCGSVTKKRMTKNELEKNIGDYDAVIIRIETHLDKKVLDNAKKLKVIGSATTGLNQIDTAYAEKLGIMIYNLHGEHTEPTAEHTLALLLSLYRNIPRAYEHIRKGGWHRYRFIGSQLKGKTIGIIGLGRIGRTVAGFAAAFGMNVIYYDPYVDTKDYGKVSLRSVLTDSDIITIHAPLNPDNKHLIGKREFNMMKKDAVLINTAREDLVDYKALVGALKANRIAGAALDVFTNEPLTKKESYLIDYARNNDNLLLTPHVGASTKEAAHMAGMYVAENVAKFLSKHRE